MKSISTLLLLLLAINSQSQIKTDKRLNGLEQQISQALLQWHGAGAAVAIVEKDKIVMVKGFGYRDWENKLPVDAQTLFAIGSCTKAFTASLIGMLQDEGKLDIDKPVETYLPGFRFYNNEMNNGVTLRQMMSHTTGLPRHDFSWYFFSTSSRDSLLERVQYQEPTAGIREHWQYNNFMYALQGKLVEKITGQSWETQIQQNILLPLGMKLTNVTIGALQANSNASKGYDLKHDSVIRKLPYYNINAMSPAGSINSNAEDMAQWLITWIHGGNYKGKKIIPEHFALEAMSSQAIVNPAPPSKERPDVFFGNYGFGWMLSSYRGHYRVEHGGNIDGFSASTAFYPTDSIGIVVLVNQNGSVLPSVIRNMITDRMLELPAVNWSAEMKKQVDKAKEKSADAESKLVSGRKQGTHTSLPLKDYEGLYHHPGYGTMDVVVKNDSLFVQLGNKKIWLRHYHYDVFEPYEVDPADGIDSTSPIPMQLQFFMGTNGEMEKLTAPFEPGLKPIEFKKKPRVIAIASSDLQRYTGEYELMGTVAKISARNNTLYLFVPGQPEYELVPIGTHRFGLKEVEGYSVLFDLNEKNEVTAITFQQPNGNFKAKKKK